MHVLAARDLLSYRHARELSGGRAMDEELNWKVAPPKAYFYWKKGGQVVRSAQFTQAELEQEIERLYAVGKDATQFVQALKSLALARGST